MPSRVMTGCCAAALSVWAATPLSAAPSDYESKLNQPLSVRGIAEVEVLGSDGERRTVKLAPATRVVPGDQVIYTLEIRNLGSRSLPSPTIDYAVPQHMRYLGDTAAGPGAVITFSVDGGHSFERPEYLKVTGPDGQKRPATAADYTHLRWKLKNILKGNAVAFARFRAVVK